MAAKRERGVKDPITGLTSQEEMFCQYLMTGATLSDAVLKAGFNVGEKELDPAKAAAARASRGFNIKQYPGVKKRLEDLTQEKQQNIEMQKASLSDRFQMNLEKLTMMLMEDRHFARTGELTLDPVEAPPAPPQKEIIPADQPGGWRPEIIPEKESGWRPDARAAVQATMGLAKLHGLLIDKAEITVQGSITRMSNDELLQFIQKVHQEIGPIVEVTPELISDFPASKR